MIRAGQMRHRLRIEVRVSTQDASGEPLLAWKTLATVWAEKRKATGREVVASAQTQGRVPTEFRIRYRPDVTPAMRGVCEGRVYEFLSVIDPTGRRAELVITADEHVEETAGPDGGPYIPPAQTLPAAQVTVEPIDGLEATDAQAALEELAAREVDLSPLEAAVAAVAGDLEEHEGDATAHGVDALAGRLDTAEAQLVDASETQRGFVSTAAQVFAGLKTFVAGLLLNAKLRIAASSGTDQYLVEMRNDAVNHATAREWRIGIGTPGNFDGYLKVGIGDFGNNWAIALQPTGYLNCRVAIASPKYLAPVTGRGEGDILQWTNSGGNFNGVCDVGQNYPNGNSAVRLNVNGTGEVTVRRGSDGATLAKVDSTGQFESMTPGAGVILRSPDGTRYRLTVANDGSLVTTAV